MELLEEFGEIPVTFVALDIKPTGLSAEGVYLG
jgi:hypothetical protein